MSNFEKNMAEIFDVTVPTVVEKPTLPTVKSESAVSKGLEMDLDADYLESRQTYKELIEKGNQAIDHLLAIASETEHPRAFEVVATLIKNTSEANEKLLNMQKVMREMKGMKNNDNSKVSVDKAIFVGSTAELSKLIKGKSSLNE
jgi:hypothetical protein